MNDLSETELTQRCANGDRKAFGALLARHQRQVFAAVFRILHRREEAIDVMQTSFMRAYEHFDRYDPGQRFLSWLYRIAVNEALDQVRSHRTAWQEATADLIDGHDTPDEALAHDQQDAAVQRALMGLKIEYRTVIVLKHVQGLGYDEIAQILGCPAKTVKSRLFTARQALRDELVAMDRL
ncbi:MAG: sigma-70 family RNA polymerase sigma factor [Proteobacteria bacterium]|nr:sigma-70 family RNA polymerase sigma factor [Pseudomonadota bacterium]